jgi:dihydroorotase/N-acyl-D-amino-acid deacylase
MSGLLEDCLAEGACGFSTGLMYAPGSSAPPEELERLCRVVARAGKIYTTHMRDYAGRLPEAVDEQIELARRSGCRLQISHLQAVGRKNWDRQARALETIERARNDGVDVMFDCYPYVAGSTVLSQWLPQWSLEGGVDRMLERFLDRPLRARILAEVLASLAQEWVDLYVSAVRTQANQALVGQHLAQIAAQRGKEPAEVVLDLVAEERGEIHILEFNQSEANLRALVTHPLAIVVSDSFYVRGRPHPRLYGAFPLLVGEMSRERRWLTLTEAVRKVTDLPARRFDIARRGRLEPEFFADLVVFDPEQIGSSATYDRPDVPPTGIRWVFREGRLALGENPAGSELPDWRC